MRFDEYFKQDDEIRRAFLWAKGLGSRPFEGSGRHVNVVGQDNKVSILRLCVVDKPGSQFAGNIEFSDQTGIEKILFARNIG